MTPFFFSSVQGNIAIIEGEEARHCLKVMRHRVGEHVYGIDGQGNMLEGSISSTGKDSVTVAIMGRTSEWGEKPQQITLAVSMLHKPDRFEWLLEKCVELGATRIQVYSGKHTVKTGVRIDRLERILMAALKQCLRSRMPKIEDVGDFLNALPGMKSEINLIAHGPTGLPPSEWSAGIAKAHSVTILIGPEGDFAQDEIDEAVKGGFTPVSLGQNRLRSETAAIHLLGIVKHHMGY